MIWIPYKRVAGGTAPLKKTRGAAGFDLFAREVRRVTRFAPVRIPLGVAFEIPQGFVGQLTLRSSGPERGLEIPNGFGVIDSDYRGEVSLIAVAMHDAVDIAPGDRIAQILFMAAPEVRLTEVAELTPTERGEGGFGSTGSR